MEIAVDSFFPQPRSRREFDGELIGQLSPDTGSIHFVSIETVPCRMCRIPCLILEPVRGFCPKLCSPQVPMQQVVGTNWALSTIRPAASTEGVVTNGTVRIRGTVPSFVSAKTGLSPLRGTNQGAKRSFLAGKDGQECLCSKTGKNACAQRQARMPVLKDRQECLSSWTRLVNVFCYDSVGPLVPKPAGCTRRECATGAGLSCPRLYVRFRRQV
jgi:hypothetical protein